MVETGEKIAEVPCSTPTFTVAWHPKEPILAFACDDKVSLLLHSIFPVGLKGGQKYNSLACLYKDM